MKFRAILSLLFAVGSVYISLLHGDSRELTISFEAASCDSDRYVLYIEGWNVKRFRVRL